MCCRTSRFSMANFVLVKIQSFLIFNLSIYKLIKRFWRKYVNIKAAVSKRNEFGVTTKVINGGLECGKRRLNTNAKKRFSIYKQVLRAFNIVEKPVEKGCE